jgi:hypothetical protein
MAKALVLDENTLSAPVPAPRAAQAPTAPAPVPTPIPAPRPPKVETVPMQIRIPREAAKAIKRDALEEDQTISDFLLACYHARKKS